MTIVSVELISSHKPLQYNVSGTHMHDYHVDACILPQAKILPPTSTTT